MVRSLAAQGFVDTAIPRGAGNHTVTAKLRLLRSNRNTRVDQAIWKLPPKMAFEKSWSKWTSASATSITLPNSLNALIPSDHTFQAIHQGLCDGHKPVSRIRLPGSATMASVSSVDRSLTHIDFKVGIVLLAPIVERALAIVPASAMRPPTTLILGHDQNSGCAASSRQTGRPDGASNGDYLPQHRPSQ